MKTLFAGLATEAPQLTESYPALTRREFYEGELKSASGDFNCVNMEKALGSPLSIIRITTSTELTFRRNSQHIRKNRAGLRVLWFAEAGSIKIARNTGHTEIKTGYAGFLDSNIPFMASLEKGFDGRHVSYQVIIPPDMFLNHLHEADKVCTPFSLDNPDGQIIRELMEVLVRQGDILGEKTSDLLVQALLEATADLVRNSGIEMPRRQTLVDRRISEIENYIAKNLADPELSYDKVAVSCGISPRYLCILLKMNNTSFSKLVWENRLLTACDRLVSPKTRDYPIHEIAHMSGFKSAAHFSRMFKSSYGMAPREYRLQSALDHTRTVERERERNLPSYFDKGRMEAQPCSI